MLSTSWRRNCAYLVVIVPKSVVFVISIDSHYKYTLSEIQINTFSFFSQVWALIPFSKCYFEDSEVWSTEPTHFQFVEAFDSF